MVTVGMDDDGLPALAHAAALTPTGERTSGDPDAGIECLDPQPPARIAFDFQDWIRDREAVLARRTATQRIGDRVGDPPGDTRRSVLRSEVRAASFLIHSRFPPPPTEFRVAFALPRRSVVRPHIGLPAEYDTRASGE